MERERKEARMVADRSGRHLSQVREGRILDIERHQMESERSAADRAALLALGAEGWVKRLRR